MKTFVFKLAVLFSLLLNANALSVVLDIVSVKGDANCGTSGALSGAAVTVMGNSVYLLGGYSSVSGSYSSNVCKYTPASKTYSLVTSPTFVGGPARAYASACYTSTMGMVIAGGYDGSEAIAAGFFSADGATWYSAFTLWSAAYSGAMVCSANQVVYVGGRLGSGTATNRLQYSTYSTSVGSFSHVEYKTASWGARWGHAATLFNTTVFVIGGRNSSAILGDVYYSSWADVISSGGVWMSAPKLMTAVYGIASQVFTSMYTSGIYVVAGRSSDTDTTSVVQFLASSGFSGGSWSMVDFSTTQPLAIQDGAALLGYMGDKPTLFMGTGLIYSSSSILYSNQTARGSLMHCAVTGEMYGNWTYTGDNSVLYAANGSFDATSVVKGKLKCLRYSSLVGASQIHTCLPATGLYDLNPTCSEIAWSRADPHFVGFKGQKFDVNGLPDQTFNWYSDVDIQINAHIIQTVERTKATYVNAVSVRLGSSSPMKGIDFRVWPERRMKIWPYHKMNHPTYGQIGRIDECGYAQWTSRDVLEVHWQQYHLVFSRRRWHVPNQSFIYMDIQVRTSHHSPKVHGLLGQTHWSTGTASPDAKQGEGVIQGSIEDYIVHDGLFGLNSTYIVYEAREGMFNQTSCPTPVSDMPRGGSFTDPADAN